ncbi:MAG: hypothetical protein OEM38_00980 [Gammaproteobacteria bacterium]|nr:hypothetical protein [Gammaproteobacteria bacterium]
MFSFISNQANKLQESANNYLADEEIFAAEAIQGDTALILRVQELNDLRKYSDEMAL